MTDTSPKLDGGIVRIVLIAIISIATASIVVYRIVISDLSGSTINQTDPLLFLPLLTVFIVGGLLVIIRWVLDQLPPWKVATFVGEAPEGWEEIEE